MSTYKTTVGIEVHAQLRTKSKMFCGCANDPHDGEPNAHTCPVCLAHPGTLPTVNKEAVLCLLKMGHAISGTSANYSEFDRKNYFYPDIPKAYQISQYKFPFVSGGTLAGIPITRVHLEEDTAKSVHDQGEESLVDFNRAGVPLMELVTEPAIHSPEEAGRFARELQLLLRTIGISDANMERGQMRVEANISVSSTDVLGTKVEVKNLNSFKSVESAIAYEVARQIDLIERGEKIVQETRGWDEMKAKTFLQRKKESSEEYRYFPDPDIPKFELSRIKDFSNSRLAEITPRNPAQIRAIYAQYGLSENQIESIVNDIELSAFFSKIINRQETNVDFQLIANYAINDIGSHVALGKYTFKDAHVDTFVALLRLISDGSINSRVAKDLLVAVVFEGSDPLVLATEKGLLQKNDTESITVLVDKVLHEHQNVVLEYKAGKVSSLQFLLGQCMKLSKGSANPAVLKKVLEEMLS